MPRALLQAAIARDHMDLLSSDAVPRPQREWLESIELVRGVMGIAHESLGAEVKRILPVVGGVVDGKHGHVHNRLRREF